MSIITSKAVGARVGREGAFIWAMGLCFSVAGLLGQQLIVFDGLSGDAGNEDIFVVRHDGTTLRRLTVTTGSSVEAAHVARASRSASWSPDFSQIVFVSNKDSGREPDIYVMDRDGRNLQRLTHHPETSYSTPVWSPDGRRIAFSRWDVETETGAILTMRSDGSDIRKITPSEISAEYPSYSPDGSQIAFTGVETHGRSQKSSIYAISVDGSNLRRLTTNLGDQAPDWSPDGTRIVFDSFRDGNFEIYAMDADGSHQRRLTNHFNVDSRASWSPDGKYIAFNSSRHVSHKTEEDPAGYEAYEIYVMKADGSNVRRLTFKEGFDGHPDW